MDVLRDSSSSSSRGTKPAIPSDVKSKPKKTKKDSDNPKSKLEAANAREIFKLRFKSWSVGVGSHLVNEKERITWLAERADGKEWGMGCSLCSTFYMRMKQVGTAKTRRTFCTKWARFAITSVKSVQASCLRKHATSELHCAALRALHVPLECLTLTVRTNAFDSKLLAGAVPQPEDWLHAWAMTRQCVSNRKANVLNFTEQFISSMRVDVQAVQRRAFSQMQVVMQESIRRKKRQWLSSAFSITLLVDDKKPYRLLRFKACSSEGMITKGLLGVLYPLKVLMESPVETWDDDKSQLAADSIIDGIKAFCTPPSEPLDTKLFEHILKSVRSFTADGAAYAQKTGKLLVARCPNLILIFRDMAHMIRISARDPLFTGPMYQKSWSTLFDSDETTASASGGVIPCLQYSPEWRAKLATINNMLLEDGTLGGVLKTNLRHLGFAKQRWESSSMPQRGKALKFRTFYLNNY